MAAEAVLPPVVLHDRRLPGGPEGSRAVRAPGDGPRGRELLRLRLGESLEISAGGISFCTVFCCFLAFICLFCCFFTEGNRNPDVSQRNSDDEEQESESVTRILV